MRYVKRLLIWLGLSGEFSESWWRDQAHREASRGIDQSTINWDVMKERQP